MVVEAVSPGSLREGDRILEDGVVYVVVAVHLHPAAVLVEVEMADRPGAVLPFPYSMTDSVERIVP